MGGEPEQEPSISQDSTGQNNVDVSEARIQKEIRAFAEDEKLTLEPLKETDNPDDITQPAESVPQVDIEQATQSMGVLIANGFYFGAKYLKPVWNILEDEASAFGMAWAKVVVKYSPLSWLRFIPNLSGGTGESVCIECDAVLVTINIAQPRLMQSEHMPENKPEQRPEKPEVKQDGAMLDVNEIKGGAHGAA